MNHMDRNQKFSKTAEFPPEGSVFWKFAPPNPFIEKNGSIFRYI